MGKFGFFSPYKGGDLPTGRQVSRPRTEGHRTKIPFLIFSSCKGGDVRPRTEGVYANRFPLPCILIRNPSGSRTHHLPFAGEEKIQPHFSLFPSPNIPVKRIFAESRISAYAEATLKINVIWHHTLSQNAARLQSMGNERFLRFA